VTYEWLDFQLNAVRAFLAHLLRKTHGRARHICAMRFLSVLSLELHCCALETALKKSVWGGGWSPNIESDIWVARFSHMSISSFSIIFEAVASKIYMIQELMRCLSFAYQFCSVSITISSCFLILIHFQFGSCQFILRRANQWPNNMCSSQQVLSSYFFIACGQWNAHISSEMSMCLTWLTLIQEKSRDK
jgi:hypothetical protein